MAKTGPNTPGQSWKEATGTCSVCTLQFGIGRMVEDNTEQVVTDRCLNELCEGKRDRDVGGRK